MTIRKSRFVELVENQAYPRVSIGDICEQIVSGSTPSGNHISEAKKADSVPFLKVYNLTIQGVMAFDEQSQFVDNETHKGQLARSVAVPGDVLMNIVGPPMAKFAIVPATYPEWNMNQAIVLMRPGARVKSRYLLGALMSKDTVALLERMAVGVRQQNLNVSKVRGIEVPLAPMGVQEDFCAFAAQVDKSEYCHLSAVERSTWLLEMLINRTNMGTVSSRCNNAGDSRFRSSRCDYWT